MAELAQPGFSVLRSLEARLSKGDTNACDEAYQHLIVHAEPLVAAVAVGLVDLLHQGWGVQRFQDAILRVWEASSSAAKQNFAFTAGVPQLITTEFVSELFHHRQSGTRERHLLFSGLISSVKERNCKQTLIEMIPQIGAYSDPMEQEKLDRLIERCIREFGSK